MGLPTFILTWMIDCNKKQTNNLLIETKSTQMNEWNTTINRRMYLIKESIIQWFIEINDWLIN